MHRGHCKLFRYGHSYVSVLGLMPLGGRAKAKKLCKYQFCGVNGMLESTVKLTDSSPGETGSGYQTTAIRASKVFIKQGVMKLSM